MTDSQETMESLKQEIERLRSRVALLEKREQKCRQWFEDAPISLWEQDYSKVKWRVDEIKSMAVGDLDAYFQDHPGLVQLARSRTRGRCQHRHVEALQGK